MQNHKLWYRLGLAIFIITAIFSVGYHNHDEHFQVLELANYKMGFSPAGDLPWEFAARIRPAIQPFIVWSIGNMLQGSNIYNPFLLAFILRLGMALLYWWAILKLTKQLLPDFSYQRGKLLWVLCALLLWFIPYTSVRFSAEGFSGMLFCFAAGILLQHNENTSRRYLQLLLAGLFLGFAWFARVQLGFALVGVAIWVLFISKWGFRYWSVLLLSFIIATGICVGIDYWLYREWVFTPYNYFEVNLLHNKASEFGVSPWWGYFELFIMNGVPPLSIVLLILFFRGIWKKPVHLFTLACITFFAGHFFIGHKEMRFLFPLIIPFIYLVCIGVDSWLHLPRRKVYTIGFKVLVFMNVGLLAYRAFTPAQDSIKFQQYMYSQAREGKTLLLCIEDNPYQAVTLNMNFYRHKYLDIIQVDNLDTVAKTSGNERVFLFSPRMLDEATIKQYRLEQVYSSLPGWIRKFNFNNWQARTRIGVIYKVRK
jgi:phosphatidylinositol glycan class B